MARTSNKSINMAITPSNVYSILTNKVFNIFKIRVAKTGSIKIELAPAGNKVAGLWKSKAVEYTIGYTRGIGYWLRRQGESGSIFPLHYDRNTRKYGFDTFEEAVDHLEKLFINKYFYIKPVE